MKTIAAIALAAWCIEARAQADTTANPLTFDGYVETYYVYDFAQPDDHNRPGFFYSFNRHNEVNLNVGFVRANYDNGKVRGKLALMAGTYANANLSAEPGVMKNVFEANAGIKLSKKSNLWIDAGIFGSHIGFESAIGADCWNMTRSILAENSPYYFSGAKIGYTTKNEKWFLSALALNGWQHIRRPDGNQAPGLGHQLTWKPKKSILLNSSSFIGSDTPDSNRCMRYFHNFYGQFQLHEKLGCILGFDAGAQQTAAHSSSYDVWFSPVLIVRYAMNEKWKVAVRGEYYSDRDQVIVATGTPNGFQTFGCSLNLDYRVTENVLWRVEGRALSSRDAIFPRNGSQVMENYFAGTSLSLGF